MRRQVPVANRKGPGVSPEVRPPGHNRGPNEARAAKPPYCVAGWYSGAPVVASSGQSAITLVPCSGC